MPDEPSTDKPASDEPEWKRRRRLAAVFGDVLPETTGDDRDDDGAGRSADAASEAWLKAQRPPHHGG